MSTVSEGSLASRIQQFVARNKGSHADTSSLETKEKQRELARRIRFELQGANAGASSRPHPRSPGGEVIQQAQMDAVRQQTMTAPPGDSRGLGESGGDTRRRSRPASTRTALQRRDALTDDDPFAADGIQFWGGETKLDVADVAAPPNRGAGDQSQEITGLPIPQQSTQTAPVISNERGDEMFRIPDQPLDPDDWGWGWDETKASSGPQEAPNMPSFYANREEAMAPTTKPPVTDATPARPVPEKSTAATFVAVDDDDHGDDDNDDVRTMVTQATNKAGSLVSGVMHRVQKASDALNERSKRPVERPPPGVLTPTLEMARTPEPEPWTSGDSARRMPWSTLGKDEEKIVTAQQRQHYVMRLRELKNAGANVSLEESTWASCDVRELHWEINFVFAELVKSQRAIILRAVISGVAVFVEALNASRQMGLGIEGYASYIKEVLENPLTKIQINRAISMNMKTEHNPLAFIIMCTLGPLGIMVGVRLAIAALAVVNKDMSDVFLKEIEVHRPMQKFANLIRATNNFNVVPTKSSKKNKSQARKDQPGEQQPGDAPPPKPTGPPRAVTRGDNNRFA